MLVGLSRFINKSKQFFDMKKWVEGEVERVLVLIKNGEHYQFGTGLEKKDMSIIVRICKLLVEESTHGKKDKDNNLRVAIIKKIQQLADDIEFEEYKRLRKK